MCLFKVVNQYLYKFTLNAYVQNVQNYQGQHQVDVRTDSIWPLLLLARTPTSLTKTIVHFKVEKFLANLDLS